MITRCRPLLGTFVEITVPDEFGTTIDAAFVRIAHIHARMSFHEDASDLTAIRQAVPGTAVPVDHDTIEVLRVALALYETSGGLFDVGIGRQLVDAGFLPDDGLGDLARYDGTSADIEIVDESHVLLTRRVLVDLGGIAKGYAVDRAVETLAELGVPGGLVNAGGDLRAFGPAEWEIGFRDADGVVRSQSTIRHCAIASSSNLRDRRSLRGTRQTPHIGREGEAVLSDKRTTVVAELCVIADAMTKVAMVDADLADCLLSAFGGKVLREISPADAT